MRWYAYARSGRTHCGARTRREGNDVPAKTNGTTQQEAASIEFVSDVPLEGDPVSVDRDADHTGFDVVYVTDEATGVTTLTISGSVTTTIRNPQANTFLGDAFSSSQPTLRKAMDLSARNLAARAVSAAWEANQPKKDEAAKRVRTTAKAVSAEDIAAAAAQGAQSALAALLANPDAIQRLIDAQKAG